MRHVIVIWFLVGFLVLAGVPGVPLETAEAAQSTPADGTQAKPKGPKNGCSPEFRALGDTAVVELHGTGDLDIVLVTDPLCWHCRLGHKLLREYPEKYRSIKLLFSPRINFPGSDMAAWILEDAADKPYLPDMVDFAYSLLKQPRETDLQGARSMVLAQFAVFFPQVLDGEDLETAAARLEKAHALHVMEEASLADSLNLPGTPVLVAGKLVLLGYGAQPWLEALDEKQFCQ